MSYYEDVYKKRVGFRGDTKKEIIIAESEKEFLNNLAESPNTESVTIDGVSTTAIILTNKADQSKLSMELHSQNSVAVEPGAVVSWDNEDWLVMSTDKFSISSYNKSIMFRSNVRVKYYDGSGVLQNIPGIFLGSLSSVLREAVYRQMGIAVQLDDRRAMLIVSRNIIRTNKRLMLDGRVWNVVDYDSTGNKDLVYISLQEDSIDTARDDVVNGIADAYVTPQWAISLPHTSIGLEVGDEYFIQPVVTLDGLLQANPTLTITKNNDNVSIDGSKITANVLGTATLTVSLAANPLVQATIAVSIVDLATPTMAYMLIGDSEIRWGDSKNYQLRESNNVTAAPVAATFTLTDESGASTTLATLRTINSVTRAVVANENTQVGNVVLHAVYQTVEYVKTIAIRSLW